MQDYMSGAYDRKCEECNGLRVVLVPDKDHPDFDQEVFDRWLEQAQDKAEADHLYQMETAAERRMEDSYYGY
jgi:hypothetical protein